MSLKKKLHFIIGDLSNNSNVSAKVTKINMIMNLIFFLNENYKGYRKHFVLN